MTVAPSPYQVPPPFDKPAVDPKSGLPTFQMAQWMQRVHAILNGTPGAGTGGVGPGAGATGGNSGGIVQQITDITDIVNVLTASSGDDPIARTFIKRVAKALGARPLPQHRPGIVKLQNGGRLLDGYGAPNGAVFGSVGDIFLQLDGTTSVAWLKTSGAQTDSGWTDIGGTASPTPIYAPLVNGDLPGPTAIADPFGQFIMVPIT
jgi:hypothetical protein